MMEIEQAKKAKANLEQHISNLISEFMNQTGLTITRVSIDIVDTTTLGNSRETRLGPVEIEIVI